jgi:phosphate transport system substrate-binding protein
LPPSTVHDIAVPINNKEEHPVTRMIRGVFVLPALALAATVGLSAITTGPASAAAQKVEAPAGGSLTETGSSLMYPLWNLWVPGYNQKYSSVSIQTASTGSGTGIANAANGTASIGASDAYLSPSNVTATPTLKNIPMAVSSQIVEYNIPGIQAHINLSPQVLADIYTGKVTTWNNSEITAINSGVTLPSTPIVTLHRSDSSGDTFIFTQYLSFAVPSWSNGPGFGTTITWPNVPGALGETGNAGMVSGCKATPGCISYVGISYETQVLQNGQTYGLLGNKAGKYLAPNAASIAAEVSSFSNAKPITGGAPQGVSLIYGPNPAGYPIVNYEYAIVNSTQSSSTTAKAIRSVLEWGLSPLYGSNVGANSYLSQVGMQPLPQKVEQAAYAQVLKIGSGK